MTEEQIQRLEKSVESTIIKVVNGKIDKLDKKIDVHNEKHEEDMASIRPIIEGINGAKIVGESIKWLGSIALAWLALKTFFYRS